MTQSLCLHLKLTQHCKSAVLQLKKKQNKIKASKFTLQTFDTFTSATNFFLILRTILFFI